MHTMTIVDLIKLIIIVYFASVIFIFICIKIEKNIKKEKMNIKNFIKCVIKSK